MTDRQVPRMMRGGLSGRIYVVTRYRDLGNGSVEALQKYDVTEQFDATFHIDHKRAIKAEAQVAAVHALCTRRLTSHERARAEETAYRNVLAALSGEGRPETNDPPAGQIYQDETPWSPEPPVEYPATAPTHEFESETQWCNHCGEADSDPIHTPALGAARRERDLAVAHDRQPYPTAAAYEAACAALEKHRARANEANAKLKAVRILIGKYQEFDKDLDVRHSAMLSAARNSTILAAMDGADVV